MARPAWMENEFVSSGRQAGKGDLDFFRVHAVKTVQPPERIRFRGAVPAAEPAAGKGAKPSFRASRTEPANLETAQPADKRAGQEGLQDAKHLGVDMQVVVSIQEITTQSGGLEQPPLLANFPDA